jgi:pimeloyl-ACP methyl ester carboxylesterase
MNKKIVTLPNQETIAYLEQGSGDKNLLLIHGNFSSSVYYRPLLGRLPKTLHVYAPDLRGYGDSSYVNRFSTLASLAEDIHLFMEALEIGTAVIAGWSLGGGVAMELAARYPETTEKLILINSTSHAGYPVFKKDELGKMKVGEIYQSPDEMANDPVQVKPLLDALKAKNAAFVKYIFDLTIYTVAKPAEKDNEDYINESLKQRNLPDADYALASFNMSPNPGFYGLGDNSIQKITCPVLHVWGDKDITVPEAMVQANIQAISGKSTYLRFENCGHSPLVDKPDELTDAMVSFIQP